MILRSLFAVVIGSALCAPAFAHPDEGDAKAAEKKSDDAAANGKNDKSNGPKDKTSVTKHKVTIRGKEIEYTATAGMLVMSDKEGEAKASIFFVAYTRDGVEDPGKRPVTFAFNGGPGSSAVWLHMGVLGPRRVEFPEKPIAVPPPYELVDNPYSLLDVTDLVFIDPVSTGFSRPVTDQDKSQFHGYEQDLRSVGQFIHDYVTKYDRWRSPKFLAGESYGGLRAAGLSGYLSERYNMSLNGIVLLSPALNYLTIAFGSGNDLPYILFMPTYAATAWYHGQLDDELQKLSLDELYKRAHEFAYHDYASALMNGHTLRGEEREEVAERFAELTGLSKKFVLESNLRISMQRFAKELLRAEERTVGRFDSRFVGIEAESAGDRPEYDPSAAAVFAPFTATINDYLRTELKFEDDRVYEILTGDVQPWSYERFGASFPDASDTLRETMGAYPYLKLFVGVGYYDLATPPASVTYSVEHMRLPPEIQKNISYGYYDAGHMMYIHEESIERLRRDLDKFYDAAVGEAANIDDDGRPRDEVDSETMEDAA